jgi:alanine-synthesizing transaminase
VFSCRSSPSLVSNPWAEAIARARDRGEALIDLTCSNPTLVGLPYDSESISRALGSGRSRRYEPDPLGFRPARVAVANDWRERGLAVDPDHIVLTASTSEAYAHCFKLLCDPGDGVLVPEPSYPLFEHLARFEGVEAVPYRLAYDGAWYIDLDTVRRAAGPRARAIVLVSPNNPTGSFTRRSELRALAEIGLPIISDEVFAAYPLGDDATRARTALEVEGVLSFALGGLSKFALLPQHKLAWMTVGGPNEVVGAAIARLELLADTYLSVSAGVQHALADLVELTRPTRRTLSDRLIRNWRVLDELCRDSPLTLLRPEGGWYAVLRLPHVIGEEDWALELLDRDRVLVQPGWLYDFGDEPYLVVSLIAREPDFEMGAQRLCERVRARALGY